MQPQDDQTQKRNFLLGVYNGIFINGAEAFFHSSLVIAPFLAQLGTPVPLIGLVPALRIGGWLLPQLFAATRIAYEPFKLPWYRRMNLVRTIAYAVMIMAIFFMPNPHFLSFVVLAMIGVSAVASGIGGLSWADVTARVVPHYRLGTFWVLRNSIGGLLALVAGFVLRKILSSDIAFPYNFGYLFLIGTVLSVIAFSLFGLIKEPEGEVLKKEPFIKTLARAPHILKHDHSFRRYISSRFLIMLALIAEPFYAIYCIQYLNAPLSMLGIFIMLSTCATITSNVLLRKRANSGRNVEVYRIGVFFLLLAPLLALLMPTWKLFILVFMCSAAGQAAVNIAVWNLLYVVSNDSERPIYVGTSNSILAVPSFAPIIAGFFIEAVGKGTGYGLGYKMAFVAAAIFALAAGYQLLNFASLEQLDRAALEH